MSLAEWVSLAVLGGAGAVLRYLLDGWIGGRSATGFPLGTFAINSSGSFALGILTGSHVSSGVLFLVGTGFLGAFTTFSTWMFETLRLAEDGESSLAGWNLAANLVVGLAAGGAGWAIGAIG